MRSAWRERLEDLLERKRLSGRTEGYLKSLRRELTKMFEALERADLRAHPKHLREREVAHIAAMFPAGRLGSQRNAKYHLDLLEMFLRENGNDVIQRMGMKFDDEPRLAWMPTREQADAARVASEELGGYARFAVFLALGMGLRRTCLERLKVDSYRDGVLYVTSKGRGAGKTRKIAVPRCFEHEWGLVLGTRAEQIEAAMSWGPLKGPIPEGVFLISSWRHGLSSMKRTSLDTIIKEVGERSGIPNLSFHPLRRRFARDLYDAGVNMEVIRAMLGHDKVSTTRIYIMLDLDDQKEAYDLRDQNRESGSSESTKPIPIDPSFCIGDGH